MGPTVFESSLSEKKKHHSKTHYVRKPDEYSAVMRNSPESTNPLSAFATKPRHMGFESQEEHEKVLLLLRKHPITQISWVLLVALMLIAPLFVLPYVPLYGILPAAHQSVILLGWYLLSFAFLLEKALSWIFNVYIITDERIVDTDFYSLIYKRISEAKLDRIEDVTSETGGMLRSLFDFGTVTVQTAAEKREFEFEDVPHPGRVVQLLNELMLEEEQEQLEGRAR